MALSLASSPALAATKVFTLTAVDAAGLGAGPFGTMTVTENNGSLVFSQTLAAGYRIHDGNANHNAFAFSILGDPTVAVSGLTSGFTAIATTAGSNVTAPPFGAFYTAIDCTSCGPGYAGGYAGTLQFTVSAASALSLASLAFNTFDGSRVFFATDLVNANGQTGNVGATAAATPAVPEPATWAMMMLGFGGMGYAMRRRPKPTTRIRFA